MAQSREKKTAATAEAETEASEQSNETPFERRQRFNRGARHFIGYINYEWEHDSGWTEF